MTETNPIGQIAKIMAIPGFPQTSRMRVVAAEPSKVSLALSRRPELTQFFGQFHRGVDTVLADQADGAAVTTAFPKGRIAITVENGINFLGPADGDEITARAGAVQVGGTIAVANVEMISQKKDAKRVCALATATMRAVEFPFEQADTSRQ